MFLNSLTFLILIDAEVFYLILNIIDLGFRDVNWEDLSVTNPKYLKELFPFSGKLDSKIELSGIGTF